MSPTFKRHLRYAKPYRWLIIGAIGAGILKFSLALLLPWALGYVIDTVIPQVKEHGDFSGLWRVLGLLTLAFILRGVVTYYRSIWSAIAEQRTIFDIRVDLFRHVQRLSLAYHSNRRTGQTTSRLINDLNAAEGTLERGLVSISMDLFFLVGVIIFLMVWDWRLATVSMFTLPIYGLVFRYLNPRLRRISTAVQAAMEELSGEATEKIAGLRVVISFVREKTEELSFFRRHRHYYAQVVQRERLRMVLTSIAEFLQSFGPILVIFYGSYLVATSGGAFTIGELVTFYGFLSHLYLPTRRLADYSAQLAQKLAALDRVFEVLDSQPDIQDNPNAMPLLKAAGALEFRDVQFAYTPAQPVLKGLSFKVEAGQAVAVVGRSGAGKSTLMSLVPRFYDVNGGAILIDGHDVRDLTVRSLREKIGIVHQDPILFTGTVRENILYGRNSAADAEMREAARMAHVDEFVESLPQAYDTLVGERGITLSGGQKQRLSIARAFLRNPSILILDEATSNLDSGAELIIQDALRELMRGRTTLVIAHRLSTIVDCDFVVVLSDGRLTQQGPHDELIHQAGPYRQFCKEQFGDVRLEDIARRAI